MTKDATHMGSDLERVQSHRHLELSFISLQVLLDAPIGSGARTILMTAHEHQDELHLELILHESAKGAQVWNVGPGLDQRDDDVSESAKGGVSTMPGWEVSQ